MVISLEMSTKIYSKISERITLGISLFGFPDILIEFILTIDPQIPQKILNFAGDYTYRKYTKNYLLHRVF